MKCPRLGDGVRAAAHDVEKMDPACGVAHGGTARIRADSAQGFDQATTELIKNLKTQLEEFRVRVKQSPGEVKIEHRPGYTGGGSFGGVFVLVLGLLALGRCLSRSASASVPAIRDDAR